MRSMLHLNQITGSLLKHVPMERFPSGTTRSQISASLLCKGLGEIVCDLNQITVWIT